MNKQGYHGDDQVILNLRRPIKGEVVTASIGLALDFLTDHDFGPSRTVDPALQWLTTPNLQFNVGVYVWISKAAPDYNPYVAVSFRY